MKRILRIVLDVEFEGLPDQVRAELRRGMCLDELAAERGEEPLEIPTLADVSAAEAANVLDDVRNPAMWTEFFGGSEVYAQIAGTKVLSADWVTARANSGECT
jgi:hypothetical protein